MNLNLLSHLVISDCTKKQPHRKIKKYLIRPKILLLFLFKDISTNFNYKQVTVLEGRSITGIDFRFKSIVCFCVIDDELSFIHFQVATYF